MHRLLQVVLDKSFGKTFDPEQASPELKKLLGLIEQSYFDYDRQLHLMEHSLETSSKELTEANRNLLQSNNLLKSVTESVADLIFYKDTDLRYIGCNRKFADFVGRSVTEVIDRDDYELFDKTQADLFRAMDIRMFENGQPSTTKEWVSHGDGVKSYFLTIKSPLLDRQGNLIGLVGISHDITKEYLLEQDIKIKDAILIQQAKLASMGEMIGNIAHQWRQPLNAIGLLIQNIELAYQKGRIDDVFIEKTVGKGKRLTSQMSQTIDDFRNFFRPDKQKEVFLLSRQIAETLELVKASFMSHQIELKAKIEEGLYLEGFPNEFSQVLLNLLTNAKDALIEHQPGHRVIRIDAHLTGGRIAIDVSDNGGGIPEAIVEKVFEPYFTTKEEGKGMGIGLYMSKSIVENNMDGQISVKNNREGSCFRMLFNAATPPRKY